MDQDPIKMASELATRINEIETRKRSLADQFRALGGQQEKIAEQIEELKGSIIGRGLLAEPIEPHNMYRTRNGSVVMTLPPQQLEPGIVNSVMDVVVIRGGHGVEKTRGDKPGSVYFVQWREPPPEEKAAVRRAEDNEELPDEIRKALARKRREMEDDSEVVINEAPDIWRLDGTSFVGMYGMGIVERLAPVPVP